MNKLCTTPKIKKVPVPSLTSGKNPVSIQSVTFPVTFPVTFSTGFFVGSGDCMTIKDIAKQSGVSVSTVSRVLNNRPDVSEAIRKKVLAVVAETGYIPNDSARDLVKTRSDAIGVITRGIGNLFFSDMLKTVAREIDKAGMTMVLRQIDSDADEVAVGALLEREKKLRGIIFLGGRFDYTPEELRTINVPFVCCTYTNSFGTLDETAYASVSIDDQQTAFDAVEYLINQGHRKIAALVPSCSDRSISELRYNGYRAALFSADIPFDKNLVVETSGCFEMEDAYRGTLELLDRGAAFTALFTLSDTMAMASMKALWDRGIRVPEDVSVVGVDGLTMSRYYTPVLTTMVQPGEELGRESVAILMEMLRGEGPRQTTLRASLRVGGSCRQL